MSYVAPTVDDFENYFFRDFPFGADIEKNVVEQDVQRALDQAVCQINQTLFCSQAEYTTGYLLLAAHYLVLNIQSSSQGLSGSFDWNTTSKSVGSVSTSQQIPQSIMDNPAFAWYTKTNYGAQYLMMIYPRLAGQLFIVKGTTQP